MRNRLIPFILALCLVMSVMTVATGSLAAGDNSLWIDGTKVTLPGNGGHDLSRQ